MQYEIETEEQKSCPDTLELLSFCTWDIVPGISVAIPLNITIIYK